MAEQMQSDESAPIDGDESAQEADEMTQMRAELEEAVREKKQFLAMAQRAQADLTNYKRRVAEEHEELTRNAKLRLLLKMLAIVDDQNRAMALVPDDAVAPGWLEGLRLVHRNLVNILESEGVTKIEAEGQPFEPTEQEAVSYEETPEGKEGMVVRVIRDGYKLNDKVLRAAQVAVSKPSQPQEEPEGTDQEEK